MKFMGELQGRPHGSDAEDTFESKQFSAGHIFPKEGLQKGQISDFMQWNVKIFSCLVVWAGAK